MIEIEALGQASSAVTYIVGESQLKKAYVIDPGIRLLEIEEVLFRREWIPIAVLLTHAHIAHAARAWDLCAKFGIGLRAHSAELPNLQRLPAIGEMRGICGVKSPQVVQFLKEGNRLELLDGCVWETPSHSEGSLTYQFGNGFFVGDSTPVIKNIPAGSTIYPGHGFPCDVNKLRLSSK